MVHTGYTEVVHGLHYGRATSTNAKQEDVSLTGYYISGAALQSGSKSY